MLFRLLLSVFVYLSLIMSVQAAECRATFADGLTNSNNDGNIKFEDSAQLLNNPDTILATTDIDNDGDVHSCGSANCNASGSVVPQLHSSYIGYSSSSNLSVNGTTITISANDYKDVTVKSGGSLTMSAAYSSYHFKKLKVESGSFIYLTAGDYFLEEIEIKGTSQIIVQGAGTARIYIKEKAEFKESVINGGGSGDPSRLVLYSFDDVKIEDEASIAGYIYSEKKIEIKDNSKILGAISSEDELKLKDNASVTYEDSIADTDFGSMCDPFLPTTPVVEAAWYFDENEWDAILGEVVDSGGNGFHGVASQSMTNSADGVVCNAADLRADGTNDYISLDNGALDNLNDFSISVWGKLDSTRSGAQTIFAGASSSHINGVLMFFSNTNSLSLYFRNAIVASYSLPAINDNLWHHYVWTRSAGQHCLYRDGVNQGCQTSSYTGAVSVDPGGLIIGQEQDSLGGSFSSSQDWEGLVDEPMIFSNTLTPANVSSVYANQLAGSNWDGSSRVCPAPPPPPVSVPPPAPRADWHFDEDDWYAISGEVVDSAGNDFHGIASQSMTNSADGVVCNAADLRVDGTSDYITLDNRALDNLTDFSISVWGKLDSTRSGIQSLFSAASSAHTNGVMIYFLNNSTLQLYFRGSVIATYSLPAINDDLWHHYVWTRSAGRHCLFRDGVNQGCRTIAYTGAVSVNPGGLLIGQDQDSVGGSFDALQDWEGLVDEPMVFESELSSGQVSALYANQAAGNNYDGTSRRCDLPVPVVNYRFDTCNWADAQDVVDSSPNRLDAYAVNGVLSTVGGQVCGLAQFDSADDYVRLPDTGKVDITDTLTAMAWVYLKNTPSGLKTILSKDTNYEFHVNSNRQVYWWWNDSDNNTRSFTSGRQISLNQWHHVAVVYQSGFQIIYIDGQEAARQTFTGQLAVNSNDLQIGQDQGIASRFFDGDIDEVKIFDMVLSSSEVEEIVSNEVAGRNYDGALRSCSCTEPVLVDHYAVSHDRSMVSCLAEEITFTAHDITDLAVDGKDALLQISTSTMKGEWLSVVAGSGVLNNSGSGQATYRFPDNGESSVTLSLSYPDLASDPEVVNFNVTDGVSTDKRNASDAEDSNLSISDSGLLFSIPDTESCQSSLTFKVQAVKKSDDSRSCSGAVAGNRTVNFYSQYLAPATGTQPLVLTYDGVAYSLATSAPGTPVSVHFDSQGEVSMSIKYPDAGEVGLSAALTVGQKNFYGSDSFVAFPSLLKLIADNGSGLVLNNTAVSGGAIWAAARPFRVSVSGQCANGTVTPNYQPSNAELGISLHTPTQSVGGVGGSLSVSTGGLVGNDSVGWLGVSSGFSSGVFEDAAASYSEVGIINMYARDLNYYGHNISQSATSVGRFIPWFFGVTANSPEWDTHCSSGDFSYMSENIDYKTPPELVIRGFNAAGGRVYNYGGSLWKLAAQRSDRFYTDQSAAVSATLNSTIDTSSDTWGGTETDYDGAAINTMAADSISYIRNALEAPFNGLSDLTFKVVDLTDSDGACYRVDSDADGNWLEEGCSDFTISNIPAKELRFGRLSLVDAYGPETEPLSLPWVTEYYDGSGFVTNTTDSCSAWLTSEVNYSDNDGTLIASGQTVAAYAHSGVDFRVDAGDAGVTLSAPGADNTGIVGVAVDLTRMPYFFFDWDGDGSFDDAPSASLVFGQYRSNDRVIFQRQW